MLSDKRLQNWKGAYKLPDGSVELVDYKSYESTTALFDIITRGNGQVIYQKNSRVIETIAPGDQKYFDFLRGGK